MAMAIASMSQQHRILQSILYSPGIIFMQNPEPVSKARDEHVVLIWRRMLNGPHLPIHERSAAMSRCSAQQPLLAF